MEGDIYKISLKHEGMYENINKIRAGSEI